jgi:hypothetical protein
MKTPPESSPLLDDVLDESVPPLDSLGPLLRAVRVRRQRRQMAPVAMVLLIAGIAWSWTSAPWLTTPTRETKPVLATATTPPLAEPFHSRGLLPVERVSPIPGELTDVFVTSVPDASIRASDEELLALAGGRGIGLARFDGRAELLFAGLY